MCRFSEGDRNGFIAVDAAVELVAQAVSGCLRWGGSGDFWDLIY